MSRITDPESIRRREREFLDRMMEDLDWEEVERILKSAPALRIADKVVSHSGDIVLHDREVAYRYDFDLRLRLRLLLDRFGNAVNLEAFDPPGGRPLSSPASLPGPSPAEAPEEPETIRLEQMIRDPGVMGDSPPPSPEGEETERARRFSRLARDLSRQISEINGDR